MEGATVDRNVNIKVVFNEAIDKDSLTVANFKIMKGSTLAAIGTPKAALDGKTITLRPINVLDANSDYKLTISKNIKSAADATRTLGTDKEVSFKTGEQSVVTKADLKTAANALVGDGNIAEDGFVASTIVNKIDVTYSHDLSLLSVDKDSVKLYCVTDKEYVAAEAVTYAAKVIRFEVDGAYNNNNATLIPGKDYRIETKNILALDGSAAADYTRTFKIAAGFIAANFPAIIDGTALPSVDNTINGTLENIYNAKGELVKPAFNLLVRFGNDVVESTLTANNIKIIEVETQETVPVTLTYTASNKTLSIAPKENLKDWTNYSLFMSKNVKDVYDQSEDKNRTWAFNTDDYLAPYVVSSSPEVGSADVAQDVKIVITFSEEMRPATFKNNNNQDTITAGVATAAKEFGATTSVLFLDKTAAALTSVGATMEWSENNTKLTIKPDADLDLNNSYEVKILGKHASLNAVTDSVKTGKTVGTEMEDDFSLSFNTSAGDFTAPKVESVHLGSVTGTVVESGVNKIAADGKFVIKMNKTIDITTPTVTLDTFSAAYTVATEGSLRLLDVTNDQYINLGDGGVVATTNFKDLKYATIEIDFDAIAQRDGAAAIVDLAKDTKYRLILTTDIKDDTGNENPMDFDYYFNFTTGPKPFVDKVASYPAAFQTGLDVETEYIAIVITDDDSNLTKSTLNTDNIKITKKADESAAPYNFKEDYVNELKDVAVAGTGVNTGQNLSGANANDTFTVADATVAALAVGDIITIAGLTQAYVVVAKDETPASGSRTITVDRLVDNNFTSAAAITKKQGVVFKLQAGAKMSGDTEYQVKVTGVTDKVGNPADDTTMTFRTAPAAQDLEYVSGTVTDGQTGVAVDQALEFTFNTPLASATTGVAITEDGVDVTTKFDLKFKTGSEDKTIVAKPKGFLVANKTYAITFGTTVLNTAEYGGKNLAVAKTITFQTEQTASVKPELVSAEYFDLGTAGVDAGDVVKLTFNAALDDTNLDADNDFTLGGLGTEDLKISGGSLTVSTDKKTVTIVLGASPVLVPGVSTIKAANDGGNAAWTDGMGNAVVAKDVTIVKK